MFPVRAMCCAFGVSPSGFNAWHGREPSARALEDARLTQRIRHYHARSRGAYGAPNTHADLRDEGLRVGKKRVARLMRAEGLRGVCRRKWITTTVRDPEARPAPDLVERRFVANAPNQLWVADITYIPTWAGFLYLAGVLDAFSRRIVGWAMAEHLRTELVLAALNMAVGQRRPKGVVHHSDQGTQYTSIEFGLRCKEARCSIAGALLRKPRRVWQPPSSSRAGTTRHGVTRVSDESLRCSSSAVIQCITSTRLPTGLRARLRLRRPARSLWITACDPSAKPSTETGQLQVAQKCRGRHHDRFRLRAMP
jgi:HTH-like domain/Integrase core domain